MFNMNTRYYDMFANIDGGELTERYNESVKSKELKMASIRSSELKQQKSEPSEYSKLITTRDNSGKIIKEEFTTLPIENDEPLETEELINRRQIIKNKTLQKFFDVFGELYIYEKDINSTEYEAVQNEIMSSKNPRETFENLKKLIPLLDKSELTKSVLLIASTAITLLMFVVFTASMASFLTRKIVSGLVKDKIDNLFEVLLHISFTTFSGNESTLDLTKQQLIDKYNQLNDAEKKTMIKIFKSNITDVVPNKYYADEVWLLTKKLLSLSD